ncbi:MAG: hypothetical protein MZV63_60325 [Marinilabiliales bacterium]|nr:hypothetical protein [Marinilabiliales bacterium]
MLFTAAVAPCDSTVHFDDLSLARQRFNHPVGMGLRRRICTGYDPGPGSGRYQPYISGTRHIHGHSYRYRLSAGCSAHTFRRCTAGFPA